METQDIPKEKQFIESITNFFGGLTNILFGFLIGYSFITAIALSYEGGLVGWSIIGYYLMKVFMVITIMCFIMVVSKTIIYKTNIIIPTAIKKVLESKNKTRNNLKNELKKEIIMELKNGRNTKRKSS